MAEDRTDKTLGQVQGDQRKGKEGPAGGQKGIGQPGAADPARPANQGVEHDSGRDLGANDADDPGGNRLR